MIALHRSLASAFRIKKYWDYKGICFPQIVGFWTGALLSLFPLFTMFTFFSFLIVSALHIDVILCILNFESQTRQ